MVILHIAPIIWRSLGGLCTSIPSLIVAQNRLDNVTAALLVTAPNPGSPPAFEFPLFTHAVRHDGTGRLNLPVPFDRPDLAVFHSTYIPRQGLIARQLCRAGIPYVICPRGGMTRYAQSHRRWKKTLGNFLFFNAMVRRAAAVNCLTAGELEASSAWQRPMFVVGNGVAMPPPTAVASPGTTGGLRLVFVGRLHLQYKGLDILLDACRELGTELRRRGVSVAIYGPDEGGSRRVLARWVSRWGLEDMVALLGPVTGEAKAEVLRQADVFLHPSRSEGHPMAVLEALAHGVPCLLTPVTNMADEVVAAGAGWKTEATAQAIAATLRHVLSCDPGVLRAAGAAARQLAMRGYAWGTVAEQSVAEYRRFAA